MRRLGGLQPIRGECRLVGMEGLMQLAADLHLAGLDEQAERENGVEGIGHRVREHLHEPRVGLPLGGHTARVPLADEHAKVLRVLGRPAIHRLALDPPGGGLPTGDRSGHPDEERVLAIPDDHGDLGGAPARPDVVSERLLEVHGLGQPRRVRRGQPFLALGRPRQRAVADRAGDGRDGDQRQGHTQGDRNDAGPTSHGAPLYP